MKIDIHTEEGLIIIKLAGKYKITEIYDFEKSFLGQMQKTPAVIALNLRDLTYIDSSGIGSLVRCLNLSLQNNMTFVCYEPNENIMNIFRLSKLDQFLNILTEGEFLKKYVSCEN